MSQWQFILIAGVYVLVFWMFAFRDCRWPLMLIVALAPFQMDISGGGPFRFSIAELNLLLTLPVVLVKAHHFIFGPGLRPALIYLGVCIFSVIGQWRGSSAISLVQTVLYTVILVMVFASLPKNDEDYRPAFIGLILVAIFLAILTIASGSAYVLGLHKNGVGGSLAVAFVIAFELWLGARGKVKWFYLASWVVLAAGCLICLSRGAWLTAITGVLVALMLRGRVVLILKCIGILVPILLLGWATLPEESRAYAFGFDKERSNIKSRYESVDYALSQFYSNPIQGVGMGLRKDYDATNVLLMTLAETGLPGLLAFLYLHFVIVYSIVKMHRRLPKNSFAASILSLAVALTLGKFMHGLVDHYWSRGSLTVVWASIGMAAKVSYAYKRNRRRTRRAALLEEAARAQRDDNEVTPLVGGRVFIL